jgi:hypothetical protein
MYTEAQRTAPSELGYIFPDLFVGPCWFEPIDGAHTIKPHSRRASLFLRPVGLELLEVGPNVCDVLVVLDSHECHSCARHLLHRRANIFVESLFVPGNAGRFVDRGVAETFDVPALRPSIALRGGPSLILASGPMSWQGEHNRLNTCSPAAASCANVVPVEAVRAIPAITHVLIIFSPVRSRCHHRLQLIDNARCARRLERDQKTKQ